MSMRHTRFFRLRAPAVLLALCLLAFTLPALAWGPDRFYDSVDELPVSVQTALANGMQPREEYLTGHKNGGYIHLLIRTPQNGDRLLSFEETASGFIPVYAAGPLPQLQGLNPGIMGGRHTLSLKYGEGNIYTFSRYGAQWLLSYVGGKDEFTVEPGGLKAVYLGEQNVSELPSAYGLYTLERELALITEEDLPSSYEEALLSLARADVAVVNNPNPEDRLHLRVSPNQDAPSLGKFYNGTPVQVLLRQGEWVRVRLYTQEGWMMSRYLAQGEAMDKVQPAFPELRLREEYEEAPRYAGPGEAGLVIPLADWGYADARIIGLLGSDWYILVNGQGVLCYMKQAWFWAGNG